MVRRTWKCVPCGKTFGSRPGLIKPTCPSCGELLSAGSDYGLELPTPQPRPLATAGARTERSSRSSSSRSRSNPSTSHRPADPAAAIALSSSAWAPDPEPGLSSDMAPSPAPPVGRRNHVARGQSSGAPEWLRSPWTWASLGGVAVGVIFFVVLLVVRSGPDPVQASAEEPAAKFIPRAKPTAIAPAAPGNAVTAAHSASPAAQVVRSINLLELIDPDKHARGGNWRKENGALVSDYSQRAKVVIPYRPPLEYDLKTEFTRLGIDNCVTHMFTHKNNAALILGGWKGTASGFQQLGGKSANANATTVLGTKWVVGKRHTCVIKVRKAGIEAWLDGERFCVYATDGSDLSNRDWPIEGHALGVGSEVSPTVFHTIELIENPE
jgi:hypothetical protein